MSNITINITNITHNLDIFKRFFPLIEKSKKKEMIEVNKSINKLMIIGVDIL